MNCLNIDKVEKQFDKLVKSSKVHEAILHVENTNKSLSWHKCYGDKSIDSPMLMASITKLFTTTCLYKLMENNSISLEDHLHQYLDEEVLKGLHLYKGKDYSMDLKIEHLLFQTSGLPDFYASGQSSIFKRVISEDFNYDFDEELTWIKAMSSKFAPGSKKKAYYADINFDLLGHILEIILQKPLGDVYEELIFKPLGLQKTFLASSENTKIPSTYYRNDRIERPLFIQSSFASGGGVTTPRELMTFLKAFYNGLLFDHKLIEKFSNSLPLQLIFHPIHYAGGYMSVEAKIPFSKKCTLLGHVGSTGAAAFYAPQKDIFIIADVPQIANPSLAIRLAMKSALFI